MTTRRRSGKVPVPGQLEIIVRHRVLGSSGGNFRPSNRWLEGIIFPENTAQKATAERDCFGATTGLREMTFHQHFFRSDHAQLTLLPQRATHFAFGGVG